MPRKKAKARRARGTGSLFWSESRGVWVGRVGGREFRHAEQRAVAEWLRTARPPTSAVTVGEWARRWLDALAVRPASRAVYRQAIEQRIAPALGHLRLDALTAWEVEAAAARWQGSPATVRKALGVLSTMLRAAQRARLVSENVAALARKPAPAEQRFHLFTRPELRQLFDAGLGRPEWHFVAVLAGTGLRIGEALGLRPGDYDAGKGVVRVERTLTRTGMGPPKSRHSRRAVAVAPELAPALASLPYRIAYTTANVRWFEVLKELGLERRGVHQVRHSYASHLLAAGVPVADLAAALGHTPAELLRTYGHKTGHDVGAAARALLGL